MPESGDVIILGWADLLIATVLVVIAGMVSVALRIRLEKQLAIATIRTVVQLLLIGYVLRMVFELDHPVGVLAIMLVMLAAASHAAVRRSSRTFPGDMTLAFGTLLLTGFVTTFTVTSLIIGVEPWFRPQYVIPLVGMILGNGLTGISLCLDNILESLVKRRNEVEMELAHGASKWEAAVGPLSEGVRRGMIPIINSMMVVGIVSLPGMMTGQILANTDPAEAVKYQIVVMFMLAAATSIGCMVMALLIYWRCFNTHHQLKDEFILTRKG